MRDHLKILGILNIVLGCLTALAGLVILVAAGTLAGIIATAITRGDSDPQAPLIVAPIIAAVGLGIAIFFIVLGLPAIIGGWGLFRYRPWSRVLMLIVSAFHLLHVPIGTAVGIYGFWVLTSDEGRRILQSGGAALPPAASGQYTRASYPAYNPPPGPTPPPV